MQDARLAPHPNVLTQQLSNGEIVLLHVTEGLYFTLNETGSHIWELLTGGGSPHHVAADIASQYDVGFPEALSSVLELAHELTSRGLLILEEP